MRMTAGEFGRYCEKNRPKSIFVNAEDQEQDGSVTTMAFHLSFSSLSVLCNPNILFLKGRDGCLQLSGVKYIDIDNSGIEPNTIVRVVCGIYGTERFDKGYVLVATS